MKRRRSSSSLREREKRKIEREKAESLTERIVLASIGAQPKGTPDTPGSTGDTAQKRNENNRRLRKDGTKLTASGPRRRPSTKSSRMRAAARE